MPSPEETSPSETVWPRDVEDLIRRIEDVLIISEILKKTDPERIITPNGVARALGDSGEWSESLSTRAFLALERLTALGEVSFFDLLNLGPNQSGQDQMVPSYVQVPPENRPKPFDIAA